MKYDVVIIGGGPAGMISAISASSLGAKVLLIEKNDKPGNKLLLTGGGRCNLTCIEKNNKEFCSKFGKNGDFLLSSFSIFNFQKTIEFFEDLGLKKEGNKIYPESENSKDVLKFLLSKLKENKVKILTSSPVSEIRRDNNKIKSIILSNGEVIEGKKYIICTGGKSYSVTGSSGDAFTWDIGHTVTELKPALTPIEIKEKWIKPLQGISLKDICITVNNKKYYGDLLFTHFGLSGPMILNISKNIKPKDVIILDLFPNKNKEDLDKYFQKIFDKKKNKFVSTFLSDFIPEKLIPFILNFSSIPKTRKINNLTKEERLRLIRVVKEIEFNVVGLLGFDKAMITSGGVSLKEVDSKTMKSKIINNLYFAGEVLDIDGPSGGYNLQACWTTGYVAGINSIKDD
ncbi:MAG: NAD(FAD)-utilizing dehydrogenase [Parcubacteria bacterium 33_209]|nr:MAG: NAD(FAD)-utilizing dehydrogenase [Parcubacteria bacterium 33_209]